MKKTILIGYAFLIALSVAACGKQQYGTMPSVVSTGPSDLTSSTRAAAKSRIVRKGEAKTPKPSPTPTSGVPISFTPCPETYCYNFSAGDSITLPVTVVSVAGICPPKGNTTIAISNAPGAFLKNVPAYANFFALSFSPSSASVNDCAWVVKVNETITLTQALVAGGAGGMIFAADNPETTAGGSVESVDWHAVLSHARATAPPSPSPGIDIFDFNLNKLITNATSTALAGQAQRLQAVPKQVGVTLSDCNWNINNGTDIVGGYAADGNPAAVPQLGNTQQVVFYWTGNGTTAASYSVPVSVVCVDQSLKQYMAKATYTVSQPTSTVTPQFNNLTTAFAAAGYWWNGFLLSTFNAGLPAGDETLGFGQANPNNVAQVGINWPWTITAPAAGQIGIIQTKTVSWSGVATDATNWTDADNTTNCLDGTVPFEGATPVPANTQITWQLGPSATSPPNDSPNLDITSTSNKIGKTLNSVTTTAQFSDNFMYMPNNDNVGNSIWITLATLNWGYTNVGAANQGGSWQFNGAPAINKGAVTAASLLPQWNQNNTTDCPTPQ